jgi:hypothetical protein
LPIILLLFIILYQSERFFLFTLSIFIVINSENLIQFWTLSFDLIMNQYRHFGFQEETEEDTTIYQAVNPPSTHNKCGLWAVLIGLWLAGCDHIEMILEQKILKKWMTYDCGRFLLEKDTGYPSTLMFSFPDGNYLNMGEIYIGRQIGSKDMIEEEGFINTDEGRTVQLFFKIARKFKVTIRVYEIIIINNDGLAEVCPHPRCQIGDGDTIINIGRLSRGNHFYTLIPVGTIDENVSVATPQMAQIWIDIYNLFLKEFNNYKEPENDYSQIESDHNLAIRISRQN